MIGDDLASLHRPPVARPNRSPGPARHQLAGLLDWLARARPVLQLVVGIAVVALILREVDLSRIVTVVTAADPRFVLAALLLSLGSIGLRTWRWRLLLASPERYSRSTVARALVLGQFANAGLPLRVGDVARVAVIGASSREEVVRVGVTVLVERCLDGALLAGGVAVLIVFFAATHGTALIGRGALLAVVGMPLLVALAYITPAGRALVQRLVRLAAGRATYGGVGDRPWPHLSWRAMTLIGALSLLTFLASLAINALVGLAVGIDLPTAGALLVLVAVTLGAPVPSPPLRIGVFEALCWLALTEFKIPLAPAISYGVLLHLVAFAWPVLGGTALLILPRPAALVPPNLPGSDPA